MTLQAPAPESVLSSWIRSLDVLERRLLAMELDQVGPDGAALLVHRFSQSVHLTLSEVSGLLPGVLGDAEAALRGLAVEALYASA